MNIMFFYTAVTRTVTRHVLCGDRDIRAIMLSTVRVTVQSPVTFCVGTVIYGPFSPAVTRTVTRPFCVGIVVYAPPCCHGTVARTVARSLLCRDCDIRATEQGVRFSDACVHSGDTSFATGSSFSWIKDVDPTCLRLGV